MVKVSLTEASAQRSDTRSDITEDYVESIETAEEPRAESVRKPPVPRPRTSKAKEQLLKSNETNTDSVDVDKISSISEQYDPSNLTMKSEPKSYKENLKSRFQQIKSKSSKSLLKAKRKGDQGNIHRQDTISFDLLREESRAVDEKLRNKVKYNTNNCVTNTEKLAFFCEVQHLTGNEEEILNKSEPAENAAVYSRAVDLSSLVQTARNEGIYILNGFASLIGENGNLSKLNQDGIYKPEPPNSRKFDLNLLEKRLIDSEINDWFGSDGHLKFLDNPNRFHKIRPKVSRSEFVQTFYSLPTLDTAIPEEIIVTGKSPIIDINIKSIRFGHHPLFSIEHVLQEMLLNYYDIYREFVVSNKQERMTKKLDTMRAKVEKNKIYSDKGSGDVNHYVGAVQVATTNLREKLLKESKKYRDNMKNILATWKSIKKVRNKNEFSNTAIKLVIRKESTSLEVDERKWKEDLNIFCKEILEENQINNMLNNKNYKRELRKFKNDHPDEDLPDDFLKPENKSVDYEEINEETTKRFKESFRWPSEPLLNFSLNYENEITNIIEKSEEKLRRAAVEMTKIYLKIKCNNIEVCSTKVTNLNDNFTLLIDDSVSIKPEIIPEQLVIEIYEQSEHSPSKIIGSAELMLLKFKKSGQIYENAFSSKNIFHYKHDGVGSGDLNIMGKIIEKYELHYYNNLNAKLELCGILNYTLKIDNLDGRNEDDVEFVDNDFRDIIDPENTLHFLKGNREEIDKSNIADQKYIDKDRKIHTLELPYLLCSTEDLQNNLRFKLLQLREKNEPEFAGMIIPNRVKEIPSNVLVSYNRRISQEQHQIDDEPDIDENQGNKIVARRSLGRKQLTQIYVKIFQQCRNRENCLLYQDVVNEKSVPQIQLLLKTIILNFFNWFKFQPKLSKPIPKIAMNKKYQIDQTPDLTNSTIPKIKICLMSGCNFPNRKVDFTRESSDATASTVSANTKGKLRPFIEFSVNNLSVESNVSEGGNPIWNEELVIPLESSSTDYLGPNSLSGSILLNIFDSLDENETTWRTSNKIVRWLGFLHIPISAISSARKMDGIFPVRQTVLLDYEYPTQPNLIRSPGTITAFQKLQNIMYIQMSIRMEPHVPELSPDFFNTPCNEPPFVKNHLTQWNNDFNNSHSERKFRVFALDTAGRSSCITRYIRSLEPPQISRDGFDVTADQCSKYIAMIPFTESNKFYDNIWLNTEQLLKYQIGSITDHVIALTCYLLALNLEVWLLLGGGLPHGNSTAFVLERAYTDGSDIPSHYVYDVTSGIRYNILDTMCPLQKIYCVVNDLNIWANIQRSSDILLTRFDFSRRFDWLPVFNNQISAPTNSIQIRLVYTHTYDAGQLETAIEAKLRKKITKLRKSVRTMWNRLACLAIKNVLKRFEINHMHSRKQSGYGQNNEFKNICREHGLKGCILNIPFDRISTVIDIMQSTRIYNENNTHEFVLAISIQPYPNNILNLWLALCYSTL